jgi:hypothetical protein
LTDVKMQSIKGGMQVGGNLGYFAAGNPLTNPAFKIPGGESPYKQPVLPKEESPEENIPFFFPGQQQLPSAGIGNVGGLIAQLQPSQKVYDIFMRAPGGTVVDHPAFARQRTDTAPRLYDPNNYTQNNKQNPLRDYRWPASFSRGSLEPGIRPYFGNRQGPGLYGEMGTGAI